MRGFAPVERPQPPLHPLSLTPDMSFNLDDLWLEKIGKWGNLTIEQQRRIYRVLLVCAVGLSYLLDTILLMLFATVGTLRFQVPMIYGLAGLGHVLLFTALHWSGLSERFKNPHMTVWQMAYALAVQLLGMAIAPQLTSLFLAIVIIIFAFGTLRISFREAMVGWLVACLSIAGVLGYFKHTSLGIITPGPAVSAIVALAFALVLLRCIGLGYYGTALRIKMYEKTHSLEHAIKQAEHLASHDPLTDALSRRAIIPAIEGQIALCQRKGIPACIAMIDLDRFKSLNDNLGHLAGDIVLKGLVASIKTSMRESDRIGRYGGEEFILLLPATTIEESTRMLERIRLDVASTSWDEIGANAAITISCGLTELGASDTSVVAIARADLAMYDAKHKGRNRVCVRHSTLDPTLDGQSGDVPA